MLINKEMDIPSLPTSLENSRISLDFKVTGLPEDIDLKVPSLFFYNPGNTNQNAHLSVDYRRGQLIIDTIEVNWNDLQLKGEAGAEISKDKINIFSDFTLRDIPYSITGTYIPEQELTITGLHGVKATLSLGRGQEIFFQLYGTDVPIPLGEEESYVTAEIFGVFYSSTNYELRINKFVLNDLPAVPFDESYISLSGNITNDKADLNQITFSDGISNLDGSGTISYSLEKNYSVTGSFHLIGQKEDESLTADFEIIPGTTKLKGEMRNLLVSRLGQEEITGLLDGKLAYEKGSGEPQIVTDFLLKKGSYKDSPISGEGKLEYVQKHLKIYEGSFNLVNHRFREGTLSYNFDTGQISGAVNYTGNLGGENLELESKFNGSLSPIDSLPSISQSIKSPFEINAVVQGVPFGDQENNVWNIFAKKEIESITFKGGPQECINGNIRDNGDFRITLSDPLPINFESEGKLKGSEIEANLNRISLDIQSISSYLNLGFIQFLTGNTSGSLRVTGPINDPDFYGTVTVSDATADLAIFPDIVGPSSFNLVFQEKTLNLNRFKTTVDNRAGYIEGTFIIEHWTPGEFRLFIESEERQGLNVVYNFGGLTVDGYATGTLSISGNRSYILLDGDITANSTIMTVGETQTSGGGEEPYDLYLDLTLRSGRGVEFLWPSRNFPILRSFAELNQKLHITYESLTESFKVTGDIGIKGGEIFYFQRSFFIKDGNISFNEDESAFDPMLSARAEIREATSEGTAKIDLIIDESPLSEFSPRFESDPPMSDAEIAALLGGNLFSDYEGSNELSSALFLTSDIIGQFGIMRNFERTLRNALNLDLFSIRTHLFENVVRGFINESNHLDKDVPSLGKYLDNTTLFLGKYIGSDLFLEMLIQLKTNQFQAGYRTFSGLQIDSEFSLEWKTPFFLLEWEFLPRNPESLFITDNILSFSWKFSY